MTKLTIDLIVNSLPQLSDNPAAIEVGMQDKAAMVHPGQPLPGGGMRFRCEVEVVHKEGRVDFSGAFVHGRPNERFLYLSWKRRTDDGKWLQRVKTPLAGLVELCRPNVRAVEADISNRRPHEVTPISWHVTT